MFVRIAGVGVPIILLYSTAFSLVFQSVVFISKDIRRSVPSIKSLPRIMLLSLVLLLNTFTFLFAYQKTTFANAVLTHYIAPVFVVLMGWFFLKERVTARDISALVIAMAGLYIMFGGGSLADCLRRLSWPPARIEPETLGVVSGLFSGFFYALLIVMVRLFVKRDNPYVLVFFQNLFIVLYLVPFFKVIPLNKVLLFALMGLIHSTIAPYLYYYGLTGLAAHRAAVLGYLEPLGAIIFGMIFFNEIPGKEVYIGGTLIIVSGYLTISKRNRNNG